MFRENHTSNLRIEAPDFVCDTPISKSIQPPLPNTAHFAAIIGSAGSGKTSLMVNFLTNKDMYAKSFDHVHMCCPKNSLGSLKDDIWEGHPGDKMHDTLDWLTLDTIHNKARDRARVKPDPETTLLIIDDQTVWLKKKEIEAKLREIIYNRRHLRLSVWMLVQSYNAIPLNIRKTLSHFYLFRPRNKKEAESIWEELLFVPKNTGNALLKFVYRDQYDFLMGNANTGQVYRNFNEIDIADDGETLEDVAEQDPDTSDTESDSDTD
ncbi:hypothetical protein TVWG_00001 [Tetraselmis viridis virus N1]|uniref:Uncharacterized protein n=1 Tax=Tetraselmis viridis virus S1 TaxID=756285 RepID=M4QZF7_9VIRU|nr:terminase large subunit [Tetraselmis viridis virus S1]AET84766.1 hypothetical protein TVWG_00001 [Tetraselmis viridis virus N1]AGH30817.1 hypothetical protein TVSG_00017 [Tetraselmis viridis virus S1]